MQDLEDDSEPEEPTSLSSILGMASSPLATEKTAGDQKYLTPRWLRKQKRALVFHQIQPSGLMILSEGPIKGLEPRGDGALKAWALVEVEG